MSRERSRLPTKYLKILNVKSFVSEILKQSFVSEVLKQNLIHTYLSSGHPYQSNESFSSFRGVWCTFSVLFDFNGNFCMQTV